MTNRPCANSQQLTFDSKEALGEWLRTSAPGDATEVARLTLKSVAASDRKHGAGSSLPREQVAFDYIHKYWLPRFPEIEKYDRRFEEGFETAQEEIAKASVEEEERARVRDAKRKTERARQEAIRLEIEEEKRRKAQTVNKIATALNCSTRYARMLYTEGTRSKRRAEQLARIVGGSPSQYLRDRIKPGRKSNLPAYFMRAHADGCSFTDFAKESALPMELRDALNTLCGETDNYFGFDQFIATARERGVDLDTATDIWFCFVLWRIAELGDKAEHQARETWGGDVPRDKRRLIVTVTED